MARGSSRHAGRGFCVKIRTKGGTIFEVDEKVARIFGKIRTEMTYNGTFHKNSSNQVVTRLHSPSPSHSISSNNSPSMASLSSSLNSLALLSSGQQQQHHCQCNNQLNHNQEEQQQGKQSKSNEPLDTDPNQSRHCPSPVDGHHHEEDHSNCNPNEEEEETDNHGHHHRNPRQQMLDKLSEHDANSLEHVAVCGTCPIPESLKQQLLSQPPLQVCCSHQQQPTQVPQKTYAPRMSADIDCNVITLEKTRGGIFALMLRWAKHHMNDPLIEYMERQEELRNCGDGNHAGGSSLFKTPTSGRKNMSSSSKSGSKSNNTCVNYSALNSWSSSWYNDSNGRPDPRLEEVPSWDARFFSKLSRPQIYEMLHACSNLHVPLLTEMLAKTVADQMKGKSVEEVREEFGIVSDYTPEEEAALKEDYERYVERLNEGTTTTGDEDTDLDAAFRSTDSIDNYRNIYGQEDDERLASAAKGRRCCGKMCSHGARGSGSNRGN